MNCVHTGCLLIDTRTPLALRSIRLRRDLLVDVLGRGDRAGADPWCGLRCDRSQHRHRRPSRRHRDDNRREHGSSTARPPGVLRTCRIHRGRAPGVPAIKWAGIAYLAYLAAAALLSAIRGNYPPAEEGQRQYSPLSGFRQGFLCNATNPKILVFYLALLPQFLGPGAPWWAWLAHAWTLPLLGTCWCLLIVASADRARNLLSRRNIRRALDTLTATVLLGFCAKLAIET